MNVLRRNIGVLLATGIVVAALACRERSDREATLAVPAARPEIATEPFELEAHLVPELGEMIATYPQTALLLPPISQKCFAWAADYAGSEATLLFGGSSENGARYGACRENELRHACWQALLAYNYGAAVADGIGLIHERKDINGNICQRRDSEIDIANNRAAQRIGEDYRAVEPDAVYSWNGLGLRLRARILQEFRGGMCPRFPPMIPAQPECPDPEPPPPDGPTIEWPEVITENRLFCGCAGADLESDDCWFRAHSYLLAYVDSCCSYLSAGFDFTGNTSTGLCPSCTDYNCLVPFAGRPIYTQAMLEGGAFPNVGPESPLAGQLPFTQWPGFFCLRARAYPFRCNTTYTCPAIGPGGRPNVIEYNSPPGTCR